MHVIMVGLSNSYKGVSIYAQGYSVGMSGHYLCCLTFPGIGSFRYLMAVSIYAHQCPIDSMIHWQLCNWLY